MLRLLRLPGALSPPLSAGTSRACSSRCSVYEARHRIFGASLSRDPRPYKSLKNLQHAGGFIGPKVAAYYPKPHPLMRHPVFRMVRRHRRRCHRRRRCRCRCHPVPAPSTRSTPRVRRR